MYFENEKTERYFQTNTHKENATVAKSTVTQWQSQPTKTKK